MTWIIFFFCHITPLLDWSLCRQTYSCDIYSPQLGDGIIFSANNTRNSLWCITWCYSSGVVCLTQHCWRRCYVSMFICPSMQCIYIAHSFSIMAKTIQGWISLDVPLVDPHHTTAGRHGGILALAEKLYLFSKCRVSEATKEIDVYSFNLVEELSEGEYMKHPRPKVFAMLLLFEI